MRPVTPVEGRSPDRTQAREGLTARGLTMSLPTPSETVVKLQTKAKAEPACRFYALWDKVCRQAVLLEAYRRCRANAGAAVVDSESFERIDALGPEQWLGTLREELVSGRYIPRPLLRVWIPKSNGLCFGVEKGPRWRGDRRPKGTPLMMGFTMALGKIGGLDRDAGGGDGREDTAGVFCQGKTIKAICRELRVSRKVARKVLRSEATEFRYQREGQPLPRLGRWRDLEAVAGSERGEAEPRATDADPDFRGAARARLRRWLRRGPPLCPWLAA